MVILSFVGWIVVGLILGSIANKIVNLRGDDPKLGIGVAVGGAIVAGLLSAVISHAGLTAWNPWSLMFAAIGSVVGAVIWHAVRSRYVSKARYVPRRSY